jgi:predicted lipid-binding transport protein (Tim44 family)
MTDGAGAPASPLTGNWSHSDQPAIAAVRGDLFPGSAGPAGPQDDPDAGLAALEAKDPRFRRERFLEAVERAFFVVEQAWTDANSDLSRQVMADGLWQQHRFAIDQARSAGRSPHLDGLTVEAITVIAVHLDTDYDTITVRIEAASADYDLDAGGKLVRGDRQVRPWAEDWTFQRSASARTPEAGGTLADRCPNCGAPLQLDSGGVCRYCKALVSAGKYDWVLARIARVPPAF